MELELSITKWRTAFGLIARSCVTAVFFTLLSSPNVGAQGVDSLVSAQARERVAAELAGVELNRPSKLPGVVIATLGPRDFDVEGTSLGSEALRVFRVSSSRVSHGSRFLVGWDGSRILALGGFEGPELTAAAAALRIRIEPGSSCDDRLILQLVTLADPNAGRSVKPVGAGHSPSQVPLPKIGFACRALVSSERGGYAPSSDSLAYALVFDQRGQLVAWSRAKVEVP